MSVIVIQFITLDGIVSDPDGSGGTPAGGWAFRHGPETVTGDPFRLGSTLDDGVMLLGRKTWQLFSRIWPGRDDPFSARMNAVPTLIAGDLIDEYRLLTFPTIVGSGERLFPAGSPPAYLECLSAERVGAVVLARYARAAR